MAETLDRIQDEFAINLEELDLFDRPEIAAEHGFMTTPAIIINGELAFVGDVKETALRNKLRAITQEDA